MKTFTFIALCFCFTISRAQDSSNKNMLDEHLKESHSKNNWFVSTNSALKNLTAEQAMWTDGTGNHSVGQLTHHLVFWNERLLRSFRGEKNEDFKGDNKETFDKFDAKQWSDLVNRFDKIMTDIESIVENATEEQLKEWAPTLVNISAHNAYHTGQIVVVRKQQGSWKPEYGVN